MEIGGLCRHDQDEVTLNQEGPSLNMTDVLVGRGVIRSPYGKCTYRCTHMHERTHTGRVPRDDGGRD